MNSKGLSFIISAPSGTGKTTVCNILKGRMPSLKHSISHTSRAPRPNEKNTIDYYFVSELEFKAMIDRNEFIEWAVYLENYYGTSKETVNVLSQDGCDILLELDVQGAISLRKMNFDGVFILILPPSVEDLGRRLRGRSTEPEDLIQKRIETGKREISQYQTYDYVVTNFDSQNVVNTILAIIQAEKSRSDRYRPTSPDIETILKPKVKS
ncbi:MAG: guanylate kinase [Nitrospinota bacterium]|nr:guanylate kinase [Nitrospinota bacterium]